MFWNSKLFCCAKIVWINLVCLKADDSSDDHAFLKSYIASGCGMSILIIETKLIRLIQNL